MTSPVPPLSLYWHVSENFGDRMAPWLVEKITGQSPSFADPVAPAVPFLVTGSILGWSIRRGVVWGAGSAFASDLDPSRMAPPSDVFRIVATRGPLSMAKVREAGHAPVAFGDPGLLLPRFYTPKVELRARVGILSSWIDVDDVRARFGDRFPVVSSLGTVESIVDTICSWEVVVTNTLHGLVAAIAYGKPVVWASFSDKLVGDGFKFNDFFASLDVEPPVAFLCSSVSEQWAIDASRSFACDRVAERLWQACPLPKVVHA